MLRCISPEMPQMRSGVMSASAPLLECKRTCCRHHRKTDFDLLWSLDRSKSRSAAGLATPCYRLSLWNDWK